MDVSHGFILHVASTHHAFNMVNDEESGAQIGYEDAGEVYVNYSSLGRNDTCVARPRTSKGRARMTKRNLDPGCIKLMFEISHTCSCLGYMSRYANFCIYDHADPPSCLQTCSCASWSLDPAGPSP